MAILSLGKCSEATCSSLSSCMTDPTSAACTAVYGGSGALPAVLAGNKCINTQDDLFTSTHKNSYIVFAFKICSIEMYLNVSMKPCHGSNITS